MLTHVLAHIATQGDTTIMLAWRRTLKSLRHSQQGSHEETIDRQTQTQCQNYWYHYARTWAWSFSDANNPPPPTSGVPCRCPPSLNPSCVLSVRLRENPSANRPSRIRHSTGQLLVCAVVIHCRSTCFVNTVKLQLKGIIFVLLKKKVAYY